MPRELMNEQQVARYLHMDLREVLKLASREQLPGRKVRGNWQFMKIEIDHWVEGQMHTLDRRRLAGIERGVSEHHGFEWERLVVCPLVPKHGGLAVPLAARTQAKVVPALVDLAKEAGLIWNRDDLMREILQREELCSTAVAPGVALPHPRHPVPYDIAESFVVAGLSPGGVPYGAPTGGLTRLFFLICCKDDRTHLHVLARLGQLLHNDAAVQEFLDADDADELRNVLFARERELVADQAG